MRVLFRPQRHPEDEAIRVPQPDNLKAELVSNPEGSIDLELSWGNTMQALEATLNGSVLCPVSPEPSWILKDVQLCFIVRVAQLSADLVSLNLKSEQSVILIHIPAARAASRPICLLGLDNDVLHWTCSSVPNSNYMCLSALESL